MVLPILFLLGVDPKVAIATNVAAAIAQVGTGAFIFSRHKKIHYEIAPFAIPFYTIGGILGSYYLLHVNADVIKKVVAVAIIGFAIYSIINGRNMQQDGCKKAKVKSILVYPVLLLAGIYQIVVAAGAGTLMTFILMYFYDLKLKCAIYTRQIISLPSIMVATGFLMYNGMIDFRILLPLVMGRAIGAGIGSEVVMGTGTKKLTIVFTIIVVLLALKTLFS